jgi:hypothetical protein
LVVTPSGNQLGRDLEALAEVDERIAGDDRTAVLDPEDDVVRPPSGERLDSDGSRSPAEKR